MSGRTCGPSAWTLRASSPWGRPAGIACLAVQEGVEPKDAAGLLQVAVVEQAVPQGQQAGHEVAAVSCLRCVGGWPVTAYAQLLQNQGHEALLAALRVQVHPCLLLK